MTQEEKELFRDITLRLTYRVKVYCEWNLFRGDRIKENGDLVAVNIYAKSIHFKRDSGRITEIPFNRIDGIVKPYLRPMSSMTEEEKKEYYTFQYKFTLQTHEYQELDKETFLEYLDWLNSHHFDYRGLIEKGLALKAPKGMYD